MKLRNVCVDPPDGVFYIRFYVYSSDHPEIKPGVAARWDAGQRVGDDLRRKTQTGKEREREKMREEICREGRVFGRQRGRDTAGLLRKTRTEAKG